MRCIAGIFFALALALCAGNLYGDNIEFDYLRRSDWGDGEQPDGGAGYSNVWNYKYSPRGDSYNLWNMQWTGSRWRGNGKLYCDIWFDGAHTNDLYDSIIVFNAPVSGTYDIDARFYANGPYGDGVKYRIHHNYTQIYHENNFPGQTKVIDIDSIEMNAGDFLAFRFNMRENSSYDTTTIQSLTITYIEPVVPEEPPVAVPEPVTLALVGLSLAGVILRSCAIRR
ncbi:MAG: PEP-CTERM sorting domain-containing protein [Candidatus Auribacter fodinae]|jgi:hypothetical protein|uniref:PEP-CTERM sorting domain-containing protein n=1 Tax=Candidatus Auribacter fodinae TaxID=2093366 RepID=A0A3A4QZX0_9BACT|nr:MAG: PEP-CTERM sorting domain-containing protein [Candidatus Auribacter fodinae]